MQDNTLPQVPAADPMAPVANVTPAPVVSAPVTNVPTDTTAVVDTTAAAMPGPEPVVIPAENVVTDVKVELPEVPAVTPVMETPVETPVTPTV